MTDLLLPHTGKRWGEIKRILSQTIENKMDIPHLILQLDYVENLFHLGTPLNARLFDLLPIRKTFIGLGNFTNLCLSAQEREYFQLYLIPFIIRCALNIEKSQSSPLVYSVKHCGMSTDMYAFEQFHIDYNAVVSFELAISLIACSFLCILPRHPHLSFLLNEVNFTYFFEGITEAKSCQAEKLLSLLTYFDHCRKTRLGPEIQMNSVNSLRIIRRYVNLDGDLCEANTVVDNECASVNGIPLSERMGKAMVRGLQDVRLPHLFIDQYDQVEHVADELRVPMTHFVNAYVGGSVLRSGGHQEDSLFTRYPDLLVALPICHRLEEFEALWIDHFRGPFIPVRLGDACAIESVPVDILKWRRLVVMDSTCFPVWAADLQYSEACVVSEVLKSMVALFGVNANETTQLTPLSPFSSAWWDSRWNMNKTTAVSRQSVSSKTKHERSQGAVVLTSRAHSLIHSASNLTQSVFSQASKQLLKTHRRMAPARNSSRQAVQQMSRSIKHRNNCMPLQVTCPNANFFSFPPVSTPMSMQADWASETVSVATFSAAQFPVKSPTAMSTSVGVHSSTRSSFSRCRSLSTQSSIRRLSDLSSGCGSCNWNHTRGSDGLIGGELGGLTENELEYYSSTISVNRPFASSQSIASSSNVDASMPAGSSVGHRNRVNGNDCNSEQRLNVTPHSLIALESYANELVHQLMKKASIEAAHRRQQVHQLADQMSRSLVSAGIRSASLFDQWTRNLVDRATATSLKLLHDHVVQALPQAVGPTSIPPNPTVVALRPEGDAHLSNRRVSLALKSGPQVRGLQNRSQSLSYTSTIPVECNATEFPVGSMVHSNQLFTASPTSPHRTDLAVKTEERQILQDNATVLKPPVSIHVTDHLRRYADSVAVKCCAGALQRLQLHELPSLRGNPLPTNPMSKRPPGLVTTSWGKHTINSTADPQIKVMTQWIAAAVASSHPSENEAHLRADAEGNEVVASTAWLDQRVSPLVLCTNNDPRLKQLNTLTHQIQYSGCSAGTLLSWIIDYGTTRSECTNGQTTTANHSRGVSISKQNQSRIKDDGPTLFDYLSERLLQQTNYPIG